MSRIRARNTRPELLLRRALHAAGLRYRLHDRTLPGTPDLVLAGRKAVLFVHGCFWHAHDCPFGVKPASNRSFWEEKLARNVSRDGEQLDRLRRAGWRTGVVWECALKGRARRGLAEVVGITTHWLQGAETVMELGGRWSELE